MVGLGAEWFPFSRASLSGHTGFSAGRGLTSSEGPGGREREWGVGVGTFTTNLSMRIYLMPGSVLR